MRQRYLLVTLLLFIANTAQSQTTGRETSSQAQKTFILGQRLGADLERQDGEISNPAVLGYVQELENRLAPVTGSKGLVVHITLSSKSYARLLPNGALYISGDLYERLDTEAELAGLLAHQLAHAKEAATPIQTPGTIPLLSPVCVLASEAAPFRWSFDRREPERAATQSAIQAIKGAGYDPSAVLDLFSKLAYEHPPWGNAILPEDLLDLRTALEADPVPQAGYKTDSSEFVKAHIAVVAALGRGRK